MQHGVALARWAALADPAFDFDAAFARFREASRSISTVTARAGVRAPARWWPARCRNRHSSYYSALREAAEEPVLQEICRHIAADELRHYRLFYKNLDRCLSHERLGRLGRLGSRWPGRQSEDDELAYAYYAANETGRPYDRRRYNRAYARRAYALYRPHHVERGVAMLLKAAGLTPNGRLGLLPAGLAWRRCDFRAARLAKAAACTARAAAYGRKRAGRRNPASRQFSYYMDARRGRSTNSPIATGIADPVAGRRGGAEPGAIAASGWAFPLVGAGIGALSALAYVVAGLLRHCRRSAALLAVGCRARGRPAPSRGRARRHRRRVRRRPGSRRKLAIMRDSRHGIYGVVALVLSIGLRAAALAAIGEPIFVGLALIAAHAASRARIAGDDASDDAGARRGARRRGRPPSPHRRDRRGGCSAA